MATCRRFSKAQDGESALKCVNNFVQQTFNFNVRDRFLNGEALMENQSILTFFDPDKEAFFSTLYLFTPFGHAMQLYARRANASPMLLHVGSGSNNFEKAIGLAEINNFVKQLSEGLDIDRRLAWFEEAFAKVSGIDSGCSADFEVVIATREHPKFQFLRICNEVSLSLKH